MAAKREYPDQPVVAVGGVVISAGRVLLIRRGTPPYKGTWSIPGGRLELGETLEEAVRRELREETGLEVRVLELIEALERFFPEGFVREQAGSEKAPRPQYHFVILDYLCEMVDGVLRPGGDVTEAAWVREEELERYALTPAATRVVKKAFLLAQDTDASGHSSV